jgi:hypothetical protein
MFCFGLALCTLAGVTTAERPWCRRGRNSAQSASRSPTLTAVLVVPYNEPKETSP